MNKYNCFWLLIVLVSAGSISSSSDSAFYTDVAPVSIDIPSSVPENSWITPMATVKNNGTETVSFDVTCMIYEMVGESLTYKITKNVPNLVDGGQVQIVFSPDFNFVYGYYEVMVYTLLFGDMNHHNDTLIKFVNTFGIVENGTTEVGFAFKASTIIKGKANLEINLPRMSKVVLTVYDILGCQCQDIINQDLGAGSHSISVYLNLPIGIYFYNLKTEFGNKIQKFLMIK